MSIAIGQCPGGLVAKVGLDHLAPAALYGALLTLSQNLQENHNIVNSWRTLGDEAFTQEKQYKNAVIIKFDTEPDEKIRKLIREHGLKYNRFRKEWYGETAELKSLKEAVSKIPHKIEVIS